MEKLIIGVDIDGVLANFNKGFAELIARLTGRKLVDPDTYEPQTWEWPTAIGYTPEEQAAAWQFIEQDGQFWYELRPLPDAHTFVQALATSPHDIYFVTARPGLTAKRQTEAWLNDVAYIETLSARVVAVRTPTVLVTPHKGLSARALGFNAYIDDRRENAMEVWTTGARVYVPRRGYNVFTEVPPRISVISTPLDMLDAERIMYQAPRLRAGVAA